MAWDYIIFAICTINGINVHALTVKDLVRFKFAQFSHGVQETGGILNAVYNDAFDQCLNACSTRKDCALVNYRRLIQQCRLVSKDEKDQLPVTTDQTGSILVIKENIDTTSVPAQCEKCGDGQTCDKATGTCTTVECPKPEVGNGRVYGNVRTVGARLVFACEADNIIAAGDHRNKLKSVTCQEDGTWSSNPSCIHIGCSQPPTIPNTIRTTLPNMVQVTYTCDIDNDYYDVGGLEEVTTECDVLTGRWTDPDIECIKDCPAPPEIVNTDSWTTANTPGSVTTFRCLYGTRLEFKATCQGTSGTWIGLQDCSTDDVCDEYLVEQIPDSSLTAGSYYLNHENYVPAVFGGLKHVVGIVTMGRSFFVYQQFVMSYTVSYSRIKKDNCQEYFIQEGGTHKIFQGNTDTTSKQVNYLPEPLSASCIRLYPQTYISYRSLRFDVIGCDDRCTTSLVSGAYGVSDVSLTASSFYVDDNGNSAGPERARLDTEDTPTHYGGWAVNSWEDEYIQVRFRRLQRVSSIVTKGFDKMAAWVTRYHVTYSSDSACSVTSETKDFWAVEGVFIGNTDSATEVKQVLPKVINALCVRIHPAPLTDYPLTGLVGMRFDLKGCVDNVCPESPERIITPSIDSSLALRLWPGSYTKAESQSACVDDGGTLVILGSEEKERIVLNMIKGCAIYAGHVFWVDGVDILPGDVIACLFLDEADEEFPIGIADCSRRIGYICEFTME